MPKWEEYKKQAKERGAIALELYAVKSTPNNDRELIQKIMPEHLEYQKKLQKQKILVMAGPLSDETGDEMQGVGMIVYRAPDIEAAKKIADNDPMHKTGARAYEIRKWLINETFLDVDGIT